MIAAEPTTEASTLPLRTLRVASQIKPRDIIDRGGKITEYFPKDPEGLFNIERRGTLNFHIIRALAAIYCRPVEEIGQMADPAKYRAN